jgi:hypothetical protein
MRVRIKNSSDGVQPNHPLYPHDFGFTPLSPSEIRALKSELTRRSKRSVRTTFNYTDLNLTLAKANCAVEAGYTVHVEKNGIEASLDVRRGFPVRKTADALLEQLRKCHRLNRRPFRLTGT